MISPMKLITYLILLFISLDVVSAAILHGIIYDTDFNALSNVIVQVNTSTPQRFVSKEGQYSFVLDPGCYKLTAVYELPNHVLLLATENITIQGDGYYVNDLFLRPTNPLVGNVIYEVTSQKEIVDILRSYWWSLPVALIIVVLVLLLLSRNKAYRKLEKKLEDEGTTDEHLKDVLRIIKSEGGRTTQKEIRKKIPLSEAKISLLISELENKGVVKKIKKGRGNILTLNK